MATVSTSAASAVLQPRGGFSCRAARTVADLAALEADWPAAGAVSAGPTASFGWSLAAASALAVEQTPRVLVACRDETHHAVAPLAARKGWSLGRLEVLGLAHLNEPADFVYADHESLAALVKNVVRLNRPLLLSRVPADSPTIERLRRACRGRAAVVVRPQASCPYIRLDESWAAPENHLSSRRRSDYRRALRRAEKLGSVRAEVLAPAPSEVDALLDVAFAIEARSWKGANGTALACDPLRGGHLREFARWASQAGTLRIALLHIGDQPAAMQIATEEAGRLWLLKIGFDPAFADCSPGILLLAETLRYAAGRKLASYEFLGTDEAWIRVWTDLRRECVSVRVYPFGPRGAAVFLADTAAAAWRRIADRATRPGEQSTLDAANPQADAQDAAAEWR